MHKVPFFRPFLRFVRLQRKFMSRGFYKPCDAAFQQLYPVARNIDKWGRFLGLYVTICFDLGLFFLKIKIGV